MFEETKNPLFSGVLGVLLCDLQIVRCVDVVGLQHHQRTVSECPTVSVRTIVQEECSKVKFVCVCVCVSMCEDYLDESSAKFFIYPAQMKVYRWNCTPTDPF